jgi:hypothetical protein
MLPNTHAGFDFQPRIYYTTRLRGRISKYEDLVMIKKAISYKDGMRHAITMRLLPEAANYSARGFRINWNEAGSDSADGSHSKETTLFTPITLIKPFKRFIDRDLMYGEFR